MPVGFIIMQIGNPDLDKVCGEAIVPAMRDAGLDPKRVDKHNAGNLLKSEIINFIETAEIIVADLTNERPNCYLEVGFAMGIDKFSNLILTARADHQPDRHGRKEGDPKVHFDLAGYDVLYWSPADLGGFRTELEKRIRGRRAVLAPAAAAPKGFLWDEPWFSEHRKQSILGIGKTKLPGYMEVWASVFPSAEGLVQTRLLEAARESQIQTFGWPIGVVLDADADRPRPTVDGIQAEITDSSTMGRHTYDYWALRKSGDFFLLKSLFEDSGFAAPAENKIFFNTRIVRVTETLLYLARLYTRLSVNQTSVVHLRLRCAGLKGRAMAAAPGRVMFGDRKRVSGVNVIDTEITSSLAELQGRLPEHVKALLAPVFMVFEYFEVDDNTYQSIVNQFVAGRCT